MRKTARCSGGALLIILLLSGCQTILTHVKATKAMHDGRYEESVALFQEVLKKNDNNAEALKGLGETYLRMKKAPEAVAPLEKAHQLYPSDKVAGINLGLAYNMIGEHDKALQVWRPYVEKEPDTNLSIVIRKQMTLALYKDAAQKAKEALKNETALRAALKASPGDPDTLAVTYFGDKGLTEQARPLQKAIAAMLITDLSKAQSLKVVERIRVQKLLEELRLGGSGIVDKRTAPRVGRLIGAGKIVTGNMLTAGNDKMDVKGLLTNVPTGGEIGRQDAGGPVKEFFKIEKAIAFGILKDLGVQLSRKEEETIGRYATQSYPGLLYFGEGLDAQDRGEWDKAIEIFQKCLKEDPTGPCSVALLDAPSGNDVEASVDAAAMASAMGTAQAEDASAAASSSGGGDGGGC
ncbi:MAG: tetratricopeptide repeat protein [Syntrophales bacterium]|jgi:tetratricopeptide (TPR) repeat protein|nr:tetratricopeptide repeat protein [Syntrophales bacterium]MDD4339384.1 tetratricopeptide repeat protein [Syntrophales bacterium]HOG06731.1 tetratricopeptide repeat protein [Syntrophales bacterium]HPB71248.1 tetratricopeptide repeat protein [Syntrophales bacterium]HQN26241.1 tetratricopeptide repeat protein [Syntrophales bacterium]